MLARSARNDPPDVSTSLQDLGRHHVGIRQTGSGIFRHARSGLFNARSETDFSDSLGRLYVIFAEIRLAVKVEAVNGV